MGNRLIMAVLVAVGTVGSVQTSWAASRDLKLRLWVQEKDGSAYSVRVPMENDHSAVAEAFTRIRRVAPVGSISMQLLRNSWTEVQRSKATERVSISVPGLSASVENSDGMALIHLGDPDDSRVSVVIRLPVAAFEAMLADGGERLDYDAMLLLLYDRGHGEKLAIETGGAKVALGLE